MNVYDCYDGVGWGLVQWTYYTRKEGLLNHAGSATKVGDMDVQLEFLVWELTQDAYYSKQYQDFLAIDNIDQATDFFVENIEQAGIPHAEERRKEANQAYNDYANG